jgi:adenine-specific DNA-methyltransferase
MSELTQESIDYTSQTPLSKRKSLGQYMTPSSISDLLLKTLPLVKGSKVLDPAVGTGELLLAAGRKHDLTELELHGWDVDPVILEVGKKVVPTASFLEQSIFEPIEDKWLGYFDVIIGNPPYFELKKTEYTSQDFVVSSGRTNIYSLFFEKYLPLVKDGGHLAYIIPPSMNAGAYFAELRKFILANSELLHVELVRKNSHFTDALTSVQIVVLRKSDPQKDIENNPFIVDFAVLSGNATAPLIFTDNKTLILKHWADKKSIYDYGYEVITGTIPWNQHKAHLTAQQTPHSSPLYYAKDISSSNALILNPAVDSRRYLTTSKPALSGEYILVNRIVGSLDNPTVKAVHINQPNFYAENHVNVIQPRTDAIQLITLSELFKRLTEYKNLSDYLKALTGNTQLSGRELMNLIPL